MRSKEKTMSKRLPKIDPPAPAAPMRNRVFREADEHWNAFVARAEREGHTVADVLRHYVRQYGQGA